MKKLYILRHAKSSWINTDLADFDRPLNEDGLEAAPFISRRWRECLTRFRRPTLIL